MLGRLWCGGEREVREELVFDLLRLRSALPLLSTVRLVSAPVGFLTVGALSGEISRGE